MTTAATVSVDGMGPSVLAALGRRPAVTPGVGRFGSGNMVDLLAGIMRSHRLAVSESSRPRVVERGGSAVDDSWWRLGDQPGGDHAGGTDVVGHAGLYFDVSPSVLWCFILLLWSGSPLHEIKSG